MTTEANGGMTTTTATRVELQPNCQDCHCLELDFLLFPNLQNPVLSVELHGM